MRRCDYVVAFVNVRFLRTEVRPHPKSEKCHEQTCGAIRSSDQYGRGFWHQASAAEGGRLFKDAQ